MQCSINGNARKLALWNICTIMMTSVASYTHRLRRCHGLSLSKSNRFISNMYTLHLYRTHIRKCLHIDTYKKRTLSVQSICSGNDASYIQQYNRIQEDKGIDLCDTNAVATFAIIFHSWRKSCAIRRLRVKPTHHFAWKPKGECKARLNKNIVSNTS